MLKKVLACAFVLGLTGLTSPIKAQTISEVGKTDNLVIATGMSTGNSYGTVCTRDPYGTLSLRGGPGTGYATYLSIPNGHGLTITGMRHSGGRLWYSVYYRQSRGWVASEFICQ